MKLVVIESPYKGNNEANKKYARLALLDSLERGESPFASHLLYTQVLNDSIPKERKKGINAGLAIYDKADLCAVYTDNGFSSGMIDGIKQAEKKGVRIELRSIKEKMEVLECQ